MTIPWSTRVKRQKRLTVYFGDSLAQTVWDSATKQALREFNLISKKNKFGVELKQANDPPAVNGPGGADVAIATGNGTVSATWDGEKHEGMVLAIRLVGRTFLFHRDGRLEKAFTFLPQQPKISTPDVVRDAGEGILIGIALHEYLHACGLTNDEHTAEDLFQDHPGTFLGKTPGGDKLVVGKDRKMPPYFFSAATIKHVQDVWS